MTKPARLLRIAIGPKYAKRAASAELCFPGGHRTCKTTALAMRADARLRGPIFYRSSSGTCAALGLD